MLIIVQSQDDNRYIFSIFFNIKVCCVFSLEAILMSTHNTCMFFYIKQNKNALNYPNFAVIVFSKGLKNEFETTMVNELSVFEPLKFYCM